MDLSGELPDFPEGPVRGDPDWRVKPVPPRLQRRHVDIGDLAPCDTERFIKALQTTAQGIQVGTKMLFFILKITFRIKCIDSLADADYFSKNISYDIDSDRYI